MQDGRGEGGGGREGGGGEQDELHDIVFFLLCSFVLLDGLGVVWAWCGRAALNVDRRYILHQQEKSNQYIALRN